LRALERMSPMMLVAIILFGLASVANAESAFGALAVAKHPPRSVGYGKCLVI
jgi:hypothetical protein